MPLGGLVRLEEVIFIRNDLTFLIQAYKDILMALYPTDPVNHNSCPDPDPKLKKLILVHNWQ